MGRSPPRGFANKTTRFMSVWDGHATLTSMSVRSSPSWLAPAGGSFLYSLPDHPSVLTAASALSLRIARSTLGPSCTGDASSSRMQSFLSLER